MGTKRNTVLITGATGFLGNRLAKRLVEEGYAIRALARKLSNVGALTGLGVEIVFGDVGDESSVRNAMQGVNIVVHAAAGTRGTEKDSNIGTILGTRNVISACITNGIKKLLYISSCSVYEVAGYTENQVVTEEAQLERFPWRRGHYSAAKQRAETLVTRAMQHGGFPIVVLRPGTLYGPGGEVYTRMMGVSFAQKLFVVFGDGKDELPLVHVDNVVDAIVESIGNCAADNQIFNVVDQELITKDMYMKRVVKTLYPKAVMIYCPMSLLLVLTWLQEKLFAIVGKQPLLTVYRLVSSQKRIKFSTSRIECAIGWRSHVTFEQSVEQLTTGRGERFAGQ